MFFFFKFKIDNIGALKKRCVQFKKLGFFVELSFFYPQEKRSDIYREFMTWLSDCHTQCDKQIKFCNYQGSITRHDLPKTRQGPWAVYDTIECDPVYYKHLTLPTNLEL